MDAGRGGSRRRDRMLRITSSLTAASAQAWGPPPPPPPGYGYGPPPGPPPILGPRVVQKWQWGEPGYHSYRPRCWIEYRNDGWEMVKVCQ